jgi:hypothetical protein
MALCTGLAPARIGHIPAPDVHVHKPRHGDGERPATAGRPPRHGRRMGVVQMRDAASDSLRPDAAMPREGRLMPRADPVTGALGWQALTVSRRAAVAVAGICGGTVRPLGKGEWQARIPEAAITVTVTGADSEKLWCRLAGRPDSGILTVAVKPWTIATVLKCPVTALPARGSLSVRDVRIKTRMGRTVRYLVPEFTPS